MYCKEYNLGYSNVIYSIHYYKKKEYNMDKIIDKVILRYLKLKELKRIKEIFHYLDNNSKINLSYVARELNLNYNSLRKIKKYGFTLEQSIKILWFLSDEKDKNEKLSISIKQLKKIYNILSFKGNDNLDDMFIICFISIGYNEYYHSFIEKRKPYFTRLIFKYLTIFGLNKNLFSDIYQDLVLKQIEIFNRNCSRNIPQIMKYYNLCLRGFLIKELKKIKNEVNNLSLYDNKYDDLIYLDTISNESL